MATVLIVEDDPALLRGLKDNFEFEGYTVATAADGQRGLELAVGAPPDLIVLDVMLPKLNGYEICRRLRAEKLAMPIIMLTAKSQESDILLGLGVGADDYLTKPFSVRLLLARAEALLRRQSRDAPQRYEFGEIVLDLVGRECTRAGQPLKLSPKEFKLLQYFCENPQRALSRDQILNAVWGYDVTVTPRSIDRFVTTLRDKIEPDKRRPVYIATVREFGYKFAGELKKPAAPA